MFGVMPVVAKSFNMSSLTLYLLVDISTGFIIL